MTPNPQETHTTSETIARMKLICTAASRRISIRLLTRMAHSGIPGAERTSTMLMQRLFDQVADRWEAIRRDPVYSIGIRSGLAHLKQDAPSWARRVNAPENVLDACCGTGLGTRILGDYFPKAQVIGSDISRNMVSVASELDQNATYQVDDSFRLSHADNFFDLVNVVDGVFSASELCRVTKPGGAVLVTYTKGRRCPVARPIGEVAAEMEALGLTVHLHGGDAGDAAHAIGFKPIS